jgi:hypothetical protein
MDQNRKPDRSSETAYRPVPMGPVALLPSANWPHKFSTFGGFLSQATMPATLGEQIIERISDAGKQYSRLILVVGPPGGGKTKVLRRLADDKAFRYLDVGLELARALLDLSTRERSLRGRRILEDLVGSSFPVVILDNIEILFDVALRLEPLLCLQSMARNRTIIAAWNGEVREAHLTYAVPGHPEFKRYPATGLLIVGANAESQVG